MPAGMLCSVTAIPENLRPQQNLPTITSTEKTLNVVLMSKLKPSCHTIHMTRPVFHRKACQNFVTELVMQTHVYCPLQENNVKIELMTHLLSHAFQCNTVSRLILPTMITDDMKVIKNK